MGARFGGRAFAPHRHDTYCHRGHRIPRSGVRLSRRGAHQHARRGRDPASGRTASRPRRRREGFRLFNRLYLLPSLIAAALEATAGQPLTLPFVPESVGRDPALAATLAGCHAGPPAAPLFAEALRQQRWPDALLRGDPSTPDRTERVARLAAPALARVRDYLDAECARAVRSEEFEAIGGLDRYSLAQQFRAVYGTSPYLVVTC